MILIDITDWRIALACVMLLVAIAAMWQGARWHKRFGHIDEGISPEVYEPKPWMKEVIR